MFVEIMLLRLTGSHYLTHRTESTDMRKKMPEVVKLATCPFCDEPAEMDYDRYNDTNSALCGNPSCRVRPQTDSFRSVKRAIKEWNKRA